MRRNDSKHKSGINPISLKIPIEILDVLVKEGNLHMKNNLGLIFELIKSKDVDKVKLGVHLLKEHLSSDDENIKVKEIFSMDTLGIITGVLKEYGNEVDLIYESYWVLINLSYLSSYEENLFLVQNELIEIHLKYLHTEMSDLHDNIIWLISNISATHPNLRDIIISHDSLIERIFIITGDLVNMEDLKYLRNCVNFFCQGIKEIPIDTTINNFIIKSFEVFANLIHHDDQEVFSHCIWGLCFITNFNSLEIVEMFYSTQVINRILSKNYKNNLSDLVPCVQILGNLLSIEDERYDFIIYNILSLGVIDFLHSILLTEKNKTIKSSVIWALSNIAGGNTSHVKEMVDSDLFYTVLKIANDSDYNVRKETAFLVANICSNTNFSLSTEIIKKGAFSVLISQINSPTSNDPSIMELVLTSVTKLLESGEVFTKVSGVNPFVNKFELFNGFNSIEKLLNHPNQAIYKFASKILEKFNPSSNEEKQHTILSHMDSINMELN